MTKKRLDKATNKPWRLHDLRRTMTTMMNGRDEGVTAIYNRHGYQAEKRSALETWARKLETLIRPAADNVVLLRG